MIWPANSLDMNPIEHVWNCPFRAISNRNKVPATLEDLTRAVQEKCDNMPGYFINNLICEMPISVRPQIHNQKVDTV